MTKTSKFKTTRKTSFRFTKEDREYVKAVTRSTFKTNFETFLNREKETLREIPSAARRVFPYLGKDWRLVVECDDDHPVLFPLRRSPPEGYERLNIRSVENAVNLLFADEADQLRKSIIAYVAQAKKERRNWERDGMKWARAILGHDGFIRHMWMLFGPGHLSGKNLFKVLTPDTQSRIRRAGKKIERLKVTPDFAAKVISELLVEECGVKRGDIDNETLEKRFKDMPFP